MFRNLYDSDITTWSPQGRLYQIEFAMEAVKQGSACVGLKSNTHAVLVTHKRSSGELASYQKKIFKVDEHIGIAIAGLTSDARVLCRWMQNECLNHRYVYETPMQVGRLVLRVADKSQKNTQRYGSRPYGVGLLVIGYDQTGSHLFETCPSGNYFDYKAMAIGARSQSAKTYLEKHFEKFEEASLEQLIVHGLKALRETIGSQDEVGLTSDNTSVAIVGLDQPFQMIEGSKLKPYLDGLEQAGTSTTGGGEGETSSTSMVVDT
jgi:20S proteasome subunit alpha 6